MECQNNQKADTILKNVGKINLPNQELFYSYSDHNFEILVKGKTT